MHVLHCFFNSTYNGEAHQKSNTAKRKLSISPCFNSNKYSELNIYNQVKWERGLENNAVFKFSVLSLRLTHLFV